MDEGNNYSVVPDIFLKKNFVVQFFVVVILAYVLWGGFSYFKTMLEIREAAQYFHDKDYVTAYQKIQPYAMDGDPESRFQVGVMTALGLGVTKDKILATLWFNCSESSGCAPGRNEYRLALGCIKGEWGERSKEECILWMKFAADLGYRDASLWLDHYKNGKPQQDK